MMVPQRVHVSCRMSISDISNAKFVQALYRCKQAYLFADLKGLIRIMPRHMGLTARKNPFKNSWSFAVPLDSPYCLCLGKVEVVFKRVITVKVQSGLNLMQIS